MALLCTKCSRRFENIEIEAGSAPPSCSFCGGILEYLRGKGRMDNNPSPSAEKPSCPNGSVPRLSLTVIEGPRSGERFHLTKGRITIGGEGADLQVNELHSCQLEIASDQVILRSLSNESILVNDVEVREKSLVSLDEIRLGSSLFLFLAITDGSHPEFGRDSTDLKFAGPENSLSDVDRTATMHGISTQPFRRKRFLPEGLEAYLEVVSGADSGKRFDLSRGGRYLIGRKDASIILNDGKVSRKHAMVHLLAKGRYYLIDLESKNGTFLNEVLTGSRSLKANDIIRVGNSKLRFHVDETKNDSRNNEKK